MRTGLLTALENPSLNLNHSGWVVEPPLADLPMMDRNHSRYEERGRWCFNAVEVAFLKTRQTAMGCYHV